MPTSSLPIEGICDVKALESFASNLAYGITHHQLPVLIVINKTLTLLEMYKYQINKLRQLSCCDYELAFVCFSSALKVMEFLKRMPGGKYGSFIDEISLALAGLHSSIQDVQTFIQTRYIGQQGLKSRFAKLKADSTRSHSSTQILTFRDYLSASDLNLQLRSAPSLVLIIDFRSKKEFTFSRINFLSVLNIEPKTVASLFDQNSSPTDFDLEELLQITLNEGDLQLFRKRHIFEFVIIYNLKFGMASDNKFESLSPLMSESTGCYISENPFKRLIEILMFRNRFLSSRLKHYPLFLNGGLKKWYEEFGEAALARELCDPADRSFTQPLIGSKEQHSKYLRTFQDYISSGSEISRVHDDINDAIKVGENLSAPEEKQHKVVVRKLSPEAQNVSSPAPIMNHNAPESFAREFDFSTGLSNLGNSCYMNCILQCLVATPDLSAFFLPALSSHEEPKSESFKSHININNSLGLQGIVTVSYAELLKEMLRNRGKYFTPAKFRKVIGAHSPARQFEAKEQQDCIEFLNFILDSLHEDLNQRLVNSSEERMKITELSNEQEKVRENLPVRLASTIEWERYLKLNFSIIVDIFQGQYVSQLRCLECQLTSSTYNSFSTLSLPIPETLGQKSRRTLLFDCLDTFVETELLDDDNKWHCPRCKKFSRLTKKLAITRFPKILIFHFKRFKIENGRFKKLENFIEYPVNAYLDVTEYWPSAGTYFSTSPTGVLTEGDELRWLSNFPERQQTPPFRYKLYGVVNHFGNLTNGHYTSYIKKPNTFDDWRYFDDSQVLHGCLETQVLNENAYCLFYKRC